MTSISEREEMKDRLFELCEQAFDEGCTCMQNGGDYDTELKNFGNSKIVPFIESLETGEDKLRKLLRVNSEDTVWTPTSK